MRPGVWTVSSVVLVMPAEMSHDWLTRCENRFMSPRIGLTREERQYLHREAYVIVRNAVLQRLVETARARSTRAQKGGSLADDPAMTDIINRPAIRPILSESWNSSIHPLNARWRSPGSASPANGSRRQAIVTRISRVTIAGERPYFRA